MDEAVASGQPHPDSKPGLASAFPITVTWPRARHPHRHPFLLAVVPASASATVAKQEPTSPVTHARLSVPPEPATLRLPRA